MSEINRLADFILKHYGDEIGLGNPREGESAVDVAIRLLTPNANSGVTDLIANLARRVSSLEQQLTDVQRNVERQGYELADVDAKVEMALGDIVMLDERTMTKQADVVTFEKFLNSVADKVAERLVGGGASE